MENFLRKLNLIHAAQEKAQRSTMCLQTNGYRIRRYVRYLSATVGPSKARSRSLLVWVIVYMSVSLSHALNLEKNECFSNTLSVCMKWLTHLHVISKRPSMNFAFFSISSKIPVFMQSLRRCPVDDFIHFYRYLVCNMKDDNDKTPWRKRRYFPVLYL